MPGRRTDGSSGGRGNNTMGTIGGLRLEKEEENDGGSSAAMFKEILRPPLNVPKVKNKGERERERG